MLQVMAEESKKIFALKQIRLEGRDEEAASGFIDEITLLQRLRGNSNIIQLIDAEVSNYTSRRCHCLMYAGCGDPQVKVYTMELSPPWVL